MPQLSQKEKKTLKIKHAFKWIELISFIILFLLQTIDGADGVFSWIATPAQALILAATISGGLGKLVEQGKISFKLTQQEKRIQCTIHASNLLSRILLLIAYGFIFYNALQKKYNYGMIISSVLFSCNLLILIMKNCFYKKEPQAKEPQAKQEKKKKKKKDSL